MSCRPSNSATAADAVPFAAVLGVSCAHLAPATPRTARLSGETLADVAEIKREARAHIRAVEELLRKWDPIGVIPDLAEDGGPLDEYDSYAPYIVGMLHRGADLAELAAHLNYCRTGAMGLFPDREADMATANAIYQWWQAIHGSEGPNVG